MPTGYTADVQSGKVTEFRDFALLCARAFGATITMRDDPMDKPIPDAFEPSDWHLKSLEREKRKLAEYRTMDLSLAEREAQMAYERQVAEWKARRSERLAQKARYESMLAKVHAWEPPSTEHDTFQAFMADQLTRSIDFDCKGYGDEEPMRMSGREWIDAMIEQAERSIAYHEKEHAAEVERTEGRNRWIRLLRESLR